MRHLKKSKMPETVLGSVNLDLRVRWVSAVMTLPLRNYLLMGKGRKADDRAQTVQKMRAVVAENELGKWTTHRGKSSTPDVRVFA